MEETEISKLIRYHENEVERRNRELKKDAQGNFVEGFFDVTYLKLEPGHVTVARHFSTKYTLAELSNRTIVSLVQDVIPGVYDLFTQLNIDTCRAFAGELLDDFQYISQYSDEAAFDALVERVLPDGSREKIAMISPLWQQTLLGMTQSDLVYTNPVQLVPELTSIDLFCGVQITPVPAAPVFGLRSSIDSRVTVWLVNKYDEIEPPEDLGPNVVTVYTTKDLDEPDAFILPATNVIYEDGVIFNLGDTDPNYYVNSAAELLQELIRDVPAVDKEKERKVVTKLYQLLVEDYTYTPLMPHETTSLSITRSKRFRLYRQLMASQSDSQRTRTTDPNVTKLDTAERHRKAEQLMQKFLSITAPTALANELDSGKPRRYIFRAYVPYTVFASQYYSQYKFLNLADKGLSLAFMDLFSERDKDKPTVEDHCVTLWFPVFIDLEKHGVLKIFEEDRSPHEDFYSTEPLSFLTNAYEYPEYDAYHTKFLTLSFSFGTTHDAYRRIYSSHLPEENDYRSAAFKFETENVLTDSVDVTKLLKEFPSYAVFHQASEKLVSVARNFKYNSTGFSNGPLVDFLMDDDTYREPIQPTYTNIGGREYSVHGYEISLEEFHVTHTRYRRLKNVINTPNYITGHALPVETEMFRLAVSQGYSTFVRYIKSEGDIPPQFITRGSKRSGLGGSSSRTSKRRPEEKEEVVFTSDSIGQKLSSLHLL